MMALKCLCSGFHLVFVLLALCFYPNTRRKIICVSLLDYGFAQLYFACKLEHAKGIRLYFLTKLIVTTGSGDLESTLSYATIDLVC